MKNYKHIFFDLDHTLWDYEKNSFETLVGLYESYSLQDRGVTSIDRLYSEFKKVNLALWHLYDHGRIEHETIRKERFKQILSAFDAYEETLCEKLSADYLDVCPTKCHLIPDAIDILDYLQERYQLTIITNGFEEIQNTKLTSGNLHRYFDHIITSQKAGCKKPARGIFEYALRLNQAEPHEAIMIGDNPVTDIGGAKGAFIDTVLFNPEKGLHQAEPHYEIHELSELRRIL